MKKHMAPFFVAALLLFLPLLLYVGSYYALLEDTRYGQPWYRIEGLGIIYFFRPIEDIDRKLRPSAWVDTET
ncbi:hypothetical protein [Anatilimnocola floriformis]|uniref:hypothetical protein n=1 Tax=Anatilimnocola floriformis TaxID=2948575 RepID=UPI0020C4DCC5|nr:hypothetical protein [Anatilimnocola floriformis]